MASCSTIRARETCPVHIAKEHQNLCLFRTWYFGQIFHKQCTSISTSILFRQKYLSMTISRAYCLHFAPLSFLIVPRFFKPSISIGGPLSSFLKNLPPSLSAFSFVIMRFHDDEIEAFFAIKRESYMEVESMKVCSLSVGLSVVIDSRILISWSLRNLFSHDVCRNE